MRFQACILYLALGSAVMFGQTYTGQLSSAACNGISGWANNGLGTSEPVDIYDGSKYLLTQNATSYYSYQFSVTTPNSVKDDQVHLIYAYYGGTNTILSGSPMTLQCPSGSTGYQYYYDDSFLTISSWDWTKNGTVSAVSGAGAQVTGSSAAGLIAVANTGADPHSANYEVNTTLRLKSNGGVYDQYLRATSTAPSSGSSYLAVEVQNPTFNTTTGDCSATLSVYQSVSGTITSFLSTPIACRDEMQIRTSINGSFANIMVSGIIYGASGVTLSSGLPGLGGSGMPSSNGILEARLGQHDSIAPSPVSGTSFITDVYPNAVTAQWQGAVDDPNGVGVTGYYITRSGGAGSFSEVSYDATFYDATVAPQTIYLYSVTAYDFHGNASTVTSFNVATPPAGDIPPQRIGVRPTGSYWGAMGEQIDLLSGNLNYSLPLITAQGRDGLKANFGLTYNSMNWVNVAAVDRQLGSDVGYGFGWQLALGSIFPVWGPNNVLAYYLFTDSTGAQYRLNQQNGAVWNSSESTYVWYDSAANILHFRNGTYWVMGCTSAGGEPDAGTMYPTVVEDSNGNQILVAYLSGVGVNWNNSSSRISTIEDSRAQTCPTGDGYCSYAFAYASNPNGVPYLSSITSYVKTPENYTFAITQGQSLYAPDGTSFATAGELTSVTRTGLNYSWNFSYEQPPCSGGCSGTLGDGSLAEVQFPQGGYLSWTYTTFQYEINRKVEEVNARNLLSVIGGSPSAYTFSRPSADPNNGTIFVHSGMILDDASGKEKYWAFNTNTSNFNVGLVSDYQDRPSPGANPPFRDTAYTWSQDSVYNAYIGSVTTTMSPSQTWTEAITTTQTVDTHGNVTSSAITDYNNQSTRTYTNTYKTYPAEYYIYDRLSTSKVAVGSTQITLVTNHYDSYGTGGMSATNGTPREQDWNTYNSSFTSRGNLTQTVTPSSTTNIHYDTTGTVVSADDDNSHSVNITTSTATNFTAPDKLDPNGTGVMPINATYDPTNLAPASVANPLQTIYDPTNSPNGTAAYTSYDTYGRVAYTQAPSQVSGAADGAKTTYTYNYTPPWAVTASTVGASGTHWTTQTLDGIGRVVKNQVGTGTPGGTPVSEVDTVYAAASCTPLGNMSQKSEPYPGGGTAVYTTYTYQAMGLTKTITLADNSVTTYTYWGNATLAVDPASKWKLYYNDAFGNLVAVVEPDPAVNPAAPSSPPSYPVTTSNLPTGMLLTTYTYDMLNHLTLVSMPRMVGTQLQTQTRTFNYDSTTQRLKSSVNPETGTVQYAYNNDGTLYSKVQNNNDKEMYTYDSYQRLQHIYRYPLGGSEDTTQRQSFYYDSLNGVSAPGMLMDATFASAVGPNQLTFQNEYTYTPAGKVASKSLYIVSANHSNAAGTLTVGYGYDSQGALLTEAYPTGGLSLTYTLDAMERPTGLTDSTSHTWVSGVTYNAANKITAATFPSGSETWVYNSLYQLTQRTTIQSGTTLMNMTYNFAAGQNNGQIASSVDAKSGETITYQYDALKRLASATKTSGWTEAYTYDGFGNLTIMAPTGGAPSLSVTAAWQTNQINPTGIGYDLKGNITAMPPSTTMGYDVANRMVSINGSQTYAYDGSNRRVYSNASGADTIYFYGTGGTKLATYGITNFNGGVIHFTLGAQNVYFAGHLISAEGNAVAVDKPGSARWSAAGSGTSRTFYPYGVEYTTTTNDTEKYGTYTRDGVTGLDYANNRYYASIWARFTSPDPYPGSIDLRNPGSWNRYAYTLGDPISGSDPTGLDDYGDDGCPEGSMCIDGGTTSGGWGSGSGGGTFGAGGQNCPPDCAVLGIPDVNSTFTPLTDPNPNGQADIALENSALTVIAGINQANPGGFINAAGAIIAGAYCGGIGAVEGLSAVGTAVFADAGTIATGATAAAAAGSDPTFVFWSGPGAQQAAETWAAVNNGITIADTEFAQAVEDGTMNWEQASTAYAESASGVLHVFSNAPFTYFPNSNWFGAELPAIASNPNVTNLIVHGVTPPRAGRSRGHIY